MKQNNVKLGNQEHCRVPFWIYAANVKYQLIAKVFVPGQFSFCFLFRDLSLYNSFIHGI